MNIREFKLNRNKYKTIHYLDVIISILYNYISIRDYLNCGKVFIQRKLSALAFNYSCVYTA